jgi:hypothetical protein
MRCSSTINVDCLTPFFAREGASPPPGPVSDAGQEGEHEVELLLNRLEIRGVQVMRRYLMLWRGHTSADDEWLAAAGGAGALPGEGGEASEYDAAPAAPRRRAAQRDPPALVVVQTVAAVTVPVRALAAAPLRLAAPPAGFRLAAPSESEVLTGSALIGRAVLLFWPWPADGWVRGTVVPRPRCRGKTGFPGSHVTVVRYRDGPWSALRLGAPPGRVRLRP